MIIENCPCCDAKADHGETYNHNLVDSKANKNRYFFVVCTKCGLTTQDEKTLKKAITIWNKRTNKNKEDK